MPNRDQQFEALLDILYRAPGNNEAWAEFLSATARMFNAPVGALLAGSEKSSHLTVAGTFGVSKQ